MKSGKHPEKALTAMKVNKVSEPGRYADGNGLYLVVDPSGGFSGWWCMASGKTSGLAAQAS